jgi:hypothetical protein
VKNPGFTLTEVRHPELGYTSICLTIPDEALVGVNFDNFDRALLTECGGPDATISDKILGLETVTRRWEQQHAKAQRRGVRQGQGSRR